MNAPDRADLWRRLSDVGLVEGELPASDVFTPWYVRTMLGAAGWIGALFLFGFIGIAFKFVIDSTTALLSVGALCCVGAYVLFRIARENVFATQFGLAASLAGQVLFIFGLTKMLNHDSLTTYTMIFVFEALLAALVPNFIHRVMTTWAAMFALSILLTRMGAGPLASALPAAGLAFIWLNELRWAGQAALWQPLGYGLALGQVQMDASLLWRYGDLWLTRRSTDANWLYLHAPWIGRLVVAAILIGAVAWLMKREGVAVTSRLSITLLAVMLLVAALSLLAPGLPTALLIVLLGFAAGNRVLLGLGYVAFAGFLVYYYYQLEMTLLVKSIILLGTGTLLLLARMALGRWFTPLAGERPHA